MKFYTDRLLLRTLTEYDAPDILKIRSNPEINQYLHRNPPKNSFEALNFILSIRQKSANNEIVFFALSERNDPKLIGTICLWKFSEDRKIAELGYELLPNFHGKGIMSEAVSFVLNYGFNELNLEKIDAFTNKNNLNSIRLLQRSQFILNENRSDKKYPENLIFELTKL